MEILYYIRQKRNYFYHLIMVIHLRQWVGRHQRITHLVVHQLLMMVSYMYHQVVTTMHT